MNLIFLTPYFDARHWSVRELGQVASMSSIIILRAFMTLSDLVVTSMPSSTGQEQEATSLERPPRIISTTQIRQALYGESPSM